MDSLKQAERGKEKAMEGDEREVTAKKGFVDLFHFQKSFSNNHTYKYISPTSPLASCFSQKKKNFFCKYEKLEKY